MVLKLSFALQKAPPPLLSKIFNELLANYSILIFRLRHVANIVLQYCMANSTSVLYNNKFEFVNTLRGLSIKLGGYDMRGNQ